MKNRLLVIVCASIFTFSLQAQDCTTYSLDLVFPQLDELIEDKKPHYEIDSSYYNLRSQILNAQIASDKKIFEENTVIKVHFLYGSKPKKAYEDVEDKWFGGILGGHVGIEIDYNQILNFTPSGKFHYFSKRKQRHSAYQIHTKEDFYKILSGNGKGVKKTIITIPITKEQKNLLDSISNVYMENTPYDYAFIGMRCGAATYEILGQIGVLKSFSRPRTIFKIFYPRKVRKRLLFKANEEGWSVQKEQGKSTRKWEKDKPYQRKRLE